MKKIPFSIILLIIFVVFLFCFVLGKTNAMKDKNNDVKPVEESNMVTVKEDALLPASQPAENIEKHEVVEKETVEEEKNPPERMLFPCGQAIIKDYSQQPVYSKTMGDWRAHTGVDYKASLGTEVESVWDGVVEKIYMDTLWGYTIEIRHDGDIISVYKNLDESIFVKIGESVQKGQVIGKVGNSAGVEKMEESHLHFEIWTDDVPINPTSYVY